MFFTRLKLAPDARATDCLGRPVTFPKHNELDRGTLLAILRPADISVEEFIKLLIGVGWFIMLEASG